MPSFDKITVPQLWRRIGLPDSPVLIDVQTPEDFALDPCLVPGAFRVPHREVETVLPQMSGRAAVVICQKGLKLSQGAAAILRGRGIAAESLEGGALAWRAAALPMVPAASVPGRLWVTRHRPKIDRIACPWLIRRFVDPGAHFLFVAPEVVPGVAEKFGATAFDIEGARFSHRGENCTFDTMLDEFSLHCDTLDRMALVIRAADTDRHELAPQAAGLLALSVGLSRQYRDDLVQLDAGLLLYDALFRWARDGYEEGHDWPVPK